jgi:hypothetical protein
MKLRRMLLAFAAALVIALGAVSFGLAGFGTPEPTAGACARCGDGVCAKSCENKYSCPKDCGGVGGTTATAR